MRLKKAQYFVIKMVEQMAKENGFDVQAKRNPSLDEIPLLKLVSADRSQQPQRPEEIRGMPG